MSEIHFQTTVICYSVNVAFLNLLYFNYLQRLKLNSFMQAAQKRQKRALKRKQKPFQFKHFFQESTQNKARMNEKKAKSASKFRRMFKIGC